MKDSETTVDNSVQDFIKDTEIMNLYQVVNQGYEALKEKEELVSEPLNSYNLNESGGDSLDINTKNNWRAPHNVNGTNDIGETYVNNIKNKLDETCDNNVKNNGNVNDFNRVQDLELNKDLDNKQAMEVESLSETNSFTDKTRNDKNTEVNLPNETNNNVIDGVYDDKAVQTELEGVYDDKAVQTELEGVFLSKEATYWLVEFDKQLYIIDQHAAHEKILYEATLKRIEDKEFLSQIISPPIVLTLNLKQEAVIKEHEASLKRLGFEIEHFGGKEYSVSALPADMYGIAGERLLIEFIDDLVEGTPDIIMEKIASMSCKAAVKGNHTMSVMEAEALIEQLLTLDNPFHCPHGRPIIISMTKYELEKKFKRII